MWLADKEQTKLKFNTMISPFIIALFFFKFSYLQKKSNFKWHKKSCSFCHYPLWEFVTIGQCRKVDKSVNRELHLATQLLHHNSPIQTIWCCESCTSLCHTPFFPHLRTNPKTPKLLYFSYHLFPNLEKAPFSNKKHSFRFGGIDLPLRCYPPPLQSELKINVW